MSLLPTDRELVQELHDIWQGITGMRVPLTIRRIQCWEVWIVAIRAVNHGLYYLEQLSVDDALRVVIKWHQHLCREQPKRSLSRYQRIEELCHMKDSDNAGAIDRIQDDFSEAKGWDRNRPRPKMPKIEVIEQFRGKPAEPSQPIVKTPRDCLPADTQKWLDELRKAVE